MERAGEKLRRTRERLKLTYREVAQASRQLAGRLNNPEFSIALSRLADIENKGAVPSIYRLYSLCAIYRLDMREALEWYGAPPDRVPAEALALELEHTHAMRFQPGGQALAPVVSGAVLDLDRTSFLSQLVLKWGRMPLQLLGGMDPGCYRYGFIGLSDWSMFPILHPGSLVLIEERRRIAEGGWTSEFDRPVYFLEGRDGYLAGWCDLSGDRLVVSAHPSSHQKPQIFRFPGEIDLLGQVTGVAMRLSPARRRPARTPAVPAGSPNP